MRNAAKTAHVKRDYLMRLGVKWCRGDTSWARATFFFAPDALQAPGRRVSSAKSDATLSRARTSIAAPRSTRISGGRGREL